MIRNWLDFFQGNLIDAEEPNSHLLTRDLLVFGMAANLILLVVYGLAGVLSMAFFCGMAFAANLGLAVYYAVGRSQVVRAAAGVVWGLYILLAVWFVGWASGAHILIFLILILILILNEPNFFLMLIYALVITAVYGGVDINVFQLTPLSPLTAEWQNPVRIINLLLAAFGSGLLIRRQLVNMRRTKAELSQIKEQVRQNETKDKLTGLLNRNGILAQLDFEITRFERTQDPFTLIMADVDQLKVVNEQYGYAAGDQLLQEITSLFGAALRKQDLCARWGGGEFLFLLPATDLEGGAVLAEKLREEVKNFAFLAPEKTVSQTMTFGASCYLAEKEALELLSEARENLRFGKELGGNRVIWEQRKTTENEG